MPQCFEDNCPSLLEELVYGHGKDPTLGLQEGEAAKKGDIARLVQHPSRLLASGEAAVVKPVCHGHNTCAEDTSRGKAVRKYLEALDQLGDDGDEDHAARDYLQGEHRASVLQ